MTIASLVARLLAMAPGPQALARLLALVPRPALLALARAALERAETFLEARAPSDAARRIEVTSFASVYQALDALAARPATA